MSKFFSMGDSIIPSLGVDFSAALGKAVKSVAGVPAVNDSVTVPAVAIVLEGNIATRQSSLGLLGGLDAPVLVQISAAANPLKQYDTIQQAADGTFTNDAGAGTARVVCGVIAAPQGAVAGDLVPALLFTPQIRA